MRRRAKALAVLLALFAPAAAAAPRSFAYSFPAGVPPSGRALELSLTPRLGRADGAYRVDQRTSLSFSFGPLEANAGLELWLLSDQADSRKELSPSASTRARWLATSRGGAALALQAELSLGPAEASAGLRAIGELRSSRALLLANASATRRWSSPAGGGARTELEQTLAAGIRITERVLTGLEARNDAVFAGGGLGGMALYAGPSLFLERPGPGGYWLTLSFTPQVFAVLGEERASSKEPLDIRHHERFALRLIAGFSV
ncbi:MAG: hypothetical protein HYZ28_12185 [Myxococcales bacterium]|nr:hypothetical protein [Myxococcales bacterium]